MIESPPMDPPPSPIELSSVFTVFGILFVAILITISISFLIRRLCAPPSLGDCSICLSPFQPKDQLRYLPLCSHAFHADCISIWLVSNKTCPLCRSPLDHAAATAASTASIAADAGHDGSRSLLRDLSRGISSRALSFRSSNSFFTGSSRRVGTVGVVDLQLEAGEEISEYFRWFSTV